MRAKVSVCGAAAVLLAAACSVSHADSGPSAAPTDTGCTAPEQCPRADGDPPRKKPGATAPTYSDGVQNGDETDVDCGGKPTNPGWQACAQGRGCKIDTDCKGACNYRQMCVDMPSCKNQHGGDTCGTGEF